MGNRKIRTGVIIGILAAVVTVAAIIILKLISGNPEQQLKKALVYMAGEMGAYTTRLADDIDFKALAEAGKARPVHSKVRLSLTNPDSSGRLGNVSLVLDSVTDVKNKQGKVDVRAGAYGFDVEAGSIIADNNTLYFVSDLFFKGDVYSVGLENLGRDFNASVWAGYLGKKMPENASFNFFDDGAYADAGAYKDELAGIFLKNLKELASSAKYDKIEEKRGFAEEWGNASYGGVQVTVGKDAYNAAMENIKNDIFASDLYAQCIEQYKKIGADNFSTYKDGLDRAIEVFTGMRAQGDIVLDFYIDKKGRARNISTPGDIPVSLNNSKISSVSVSLDFTGTERRLDSVEGGMCFYAKADGQVLEMGISRAAGVTDESYDEDLSLRLGSVTYGDAIFSYINSWTYADKSYDMKIMADYNGNAWRLSARGGCEGIEKGKGFTFRLDSATLNVDTKDVLVASGDISVETVEEGGIKVPQNATDVFKMSGIDIMAAALKAAAAFEKFQ